MTTPGPPAVAASDFGRASASRAVPTVAVIPFTSANAVMQPAGALSAPVANTVAGMSENSIITAISNASILFLVFFM